MAQFLKGMKIVHRAQSSWGVGHVIAVSDDPPRISAQFPGRPGGPVMLSSRDSALARFRFGRDSLALLADGTAARVLRALPGPGGDLYRYTVDIPGKKPSIHSEADLRAATPREGPAEQLASGRWGNPEDFRLRAEAVRLDLERRADALGALFASRVYVKPHQVSVVHQVVSAPQPRFVLADEVGLGKTIEIARRPRRKRPRTRTRPGAGIRWSSPRWSGSPAARKSRERRRRQAGTWSSSTRRTTCAARAPTRSLPRWRARPGDFCS